MKKLTGLDEVTATVTGDAAPEDAPTYKKLLQLVVANSKARNADEARRLARLVPKIRGNEAELADDEFTTLKTLVESNAVNLNAWLHGLLLLRLDEAK